MPYGNLKNNDNIIVKTTLFFTIILILATHLYSNFEAADMLRFHLDSLILKFASVKKEKIY